MCFSVVIHRSSNFLKDNISFFLSSASASSAVLSLDFHARLFSRHLLAESSLSALSPYWQYILYLHVHVLLLCLSFVSSTLTPISPVSAAQQLWMLIFHYITRLSCFLFILVIMCSPFFFIFFPPLQASCVSLINLYHSLVNCLTFTSCIWGACSDKWNGSAVLQGRIHPLVSSTSFISCHPFIWLPFTCSSEVESPSKKNKEILKPN